MKIDDVDTKNFPQDLTNFIEQTQILLNYGKYQKAVVDGTPSWKGRKGEDVYVFEQATTSGWIYVCVSDNTADWRQVSYFSLEAP